MFKNLGLWALLFKMSPVILKFLKSAKFIKVALAGGSLTAYSYMFTLEFALILLLAIVFHEYGHMTAMKHCGIKTKGIFLIPFFGGAAVAEEEFKTRTDETYVALYGPLYGLILTIPFLIYGIMYESPLAIGLVSFMALLNLFNLFPINPLDGGRVTKSIAFSINSWVGFAVVGLGFLLAMGMIVYFKVYLLVVILIIGGLEIFFEWINHKKAYKEDNLLLIQVYESRNMHKQDIIKYSIFYILLAAAFIGLIMYTGQYEGADLALKLIKDDLPVD